MKNRIRSPWKIGLPLVLLAPLALLMLFESPPATSAPSAVSFTQASQSNLQTLCAGCHADHARLVSQTPHNATTAASELGCEGCHGLGQAHVDAILGGDFELARSLIFSFDGSPSENAERCLTCHEASRETQNFDHSEHQLNGIACQMCHSPHAVELSQENAEISTLVTQRGFFTDGQSVGEEDRWLSERLLRSPQAELCSSCHATIAAQFALPTHHRVPEGAMQCTDCHNPHGTRNQPMLRSANWETCINCHAEKRGPFLFEHAAVRLEGCTVCHTPHGSVNRNLLVRREGRFLCLQCHVDPFAANVPHGRLSNTTRGDCVRCHAAVHGSNSTPYFLD
jgi:predicted CXXCH cytochrome family protein